MLISKNINTKVRKNLLKAYTWNVALYRSETRTIVKRKEKNSQSLRHVITGECLE